MKGPVLVFLLNEADEKEGLGDAGIETFRDAPYASCAREAGQNSRDAMLSNGGPVRMTFNVLQVPANDIPAADSLIGAITSCISKATSEKERDFFQNAIEILTAARIPVLQIADYNTKGLVGPPDEADSPFNALLKGAGVSKKDSETSGGSFGIGKNASFAVSDLQAVFYSSLYEGKRASSEFAAQGKVKLVSHTDADGISRRATGYWGLPSFRAITDIDVVPSWMQRKDLGTSIFCLGFRETSDWAERMVCSLVMNFFVAVRSGDMVFEVDSGRFKINPNTIESLMSDPVIIKAAEESGFTTDLDFARDLYACQVSETATVSTLEIPGLGEMRIRILIGNGLPRRVGFIRNGMLITDNLRHFDRPLARFPNSRDFIALVEPGDANASKLLKTLENPAHDAFSSERIADSAKRSVATKALRKLGDSLREMIKDVTGIKSQASLVLDELGEFFADGGSSDSTSKAGTENDPESYTYQAVSKHTKNFTAPDSMPGGEGGAGGDHDGTGTEGDGGGGGGQPGVKGKGDNGHVEQRRLLVLNDVRNRIHGPEKNGALKRQIFFSSDEDGEVELSIQALGLNTPQALIPISSSLGVVKNGKIIIGIVAGERYSMSVCFDGFYEGPIQVLAFLSSSKEIGK